MAQRGLIVTDRAVIEEIGGMIDKENDLWIIPKNSSTNQKLLTK